MPIPNLNDQVAINASLPKREIYARWLIGVQGFGETGDYSTLPEHYLLAKIAVAYGCPKGEADYVSLPKQYIWSDIYNAISGDSGVHYDWAEKQALGWIIGATYGDQGVVQFLSYYIDLPTRIQLALLVELNGGGGAPAAFLPTDLPELELWLDANEGVMGTLTTTATDGESVRQWNNLVSGKPNVGQSNASIQPIYYDNWSSDKPSVLFQADGFLNGSGFSTWGSEFTYYVVGRDLAGSTNSGAGVIALQTNSTASARRGMLSVNIDGQVQASNGTLRTLSLFPALGEAEIYSMGFDIANNQVDATITGSYGTFEDSVTGIGTSSVTSNGITIGTANTSIAGSIYGEIHEILVYKALHSVETRNKIINYLMAKWDITL